MKKYSLSKAQQGMLVTEMTGEGDLAYIIHFIADYAKEDLPFIRKALPLVLEGNINMRLSADDGDISWYYGGRAEPPFCETEVRSISELERLQDEERCKSFDDIFDKPLYSIKLLICENTVRLFAMFHHIVLDGGGISVFTKRLSKAIEAQKQNRPFVLSEGKYEKYVEYEKKYLNSKQYQIDREYRLNAIGDTTELPSITNPSGDLSIFTRYHQIDKKLTKKIATMSSGLKISPYAFTLSAYSMFLARLYNAPAAVVKMPASIRPDEIENIRDAMGMFVNVIPLKIDYDPEELYKDRLLRVKALIKEGLAHGMYPLGDCINEFKNASVETITSFCAVSNSLTPGAPAASFFERGYSESALTVRTNIGRYDADGLQQLSFEFSKQAFTEQQAEALIENFNAFLENIATNPNAKCGELDIVSEHTKEVLETFHGPKYAYDKSKTVVNYFIEQVRLHPAKTAVVFGEKTITYSQLNAISDELAARISKHPGDVVGILIDRTDNMAVAPIAVWKTGRAYLPLDPTYPKDRLELMLKDASVKVLIAEKVFKDQIDFDGEIIYIEDVSANKADFKCTPAKAEDIGVILYTSGSTGMPKGSLIKHKNICAYLQAYKYQANIDSDVVHSSFASFGFDASLMEIYTPLINGGTLCIIPNSIRLDLLSVNEYFEENRVTHAFMTTKVSYQFATNLDNKTLKYLVGGGEKLPSLTPDFSYQYINAYGPSETVACVTWFNVDRYYADIPIGKAMANTRLYIVDKNNKLLPIGGHGELCIAGPQVCAGYLNREEKTKEVFVPNPFTTDPEYAVMYRTGDICKWMEDGNILFVGRRDFQVKIRGFRIELTEIEEVIRRFNGIKDAVVVALSNSAGEKNIAAYIVADAPVDVNELNNFIKNEKPPYMVPQFTMQIDKIPLNQNQKVNKRELPSPEAYFASRPAAATAPPEKQEKPASVPPAPKAQTAQKPTPDINDVKKILCEVLGRADIAEDLSILDAGISSISVARLAVMLGKRFSAPIRTKDFKTYDTLAKITDYVKTFIAEEKIEKQKEYPLTDNQTGVFIDQITNPDSTLYNIPKVLPLGKDIDIERLKDAVIKAVQIHPYIKCTISDDMMQIRNDDAEVKIETHSVAEGGFDTLVKKLVRPFKLTEENLYRINIIQTEKQVYLLCDFHHIISDGSSLNVFYADVDAFYTRKLPAPQKEEFSAYEYALERAKQRQGKEYEEAKEYFDKLLGSMDTNAEVPFDCAAEEPAAAKMSIDISLKHKKLEDYCSRAGITENTYFAGLFGYLLSQFKNEREALFCTVYNGRVSARLTNMFGMLVNTFPVYCDFNDESMTISQYLAGIKNQMMQTMQNDIFPLGELCAKYKFKPNILFVYQGDNFTSLKFNGENVDAYIVDLNSTKAPISVVIVKTAEGYKLDLDYRSDLYYKETITALMKAYKYAAESAAEAKDFGGIRFVSDRQRQELIALRQVMDVPENATYIDLFEHQAASTPDNIALKDKDKQLTYAQLDELSSRLAKKLQQEGVKHGELVGVMTRRSVEFVIGTLGVMKAGGSYVPLDITYPTDRLEHMITDSQMKVIVTQSGLESILPMYKGKYIDLDGKAAYSDKADYKKIITPDSRAYTIYTSGSTGKPKGALLIHKGLVNFVLWYGRAVEADQSSVFTAYASFSFDASIKEIYPPLVKGATLCIFEEEIRRDPELIVEAMEKWGATVTNFPTQFGEIMATFMTEPSTLKYLVLGGEKLKRYYQRPYTLMNVYGPTENTDLCTSFIVDKAYPNIPLGKIAENTFGYIVNKYIQLCQPNMCGELCLAGPQVALGYLNREELTRERFIPNPFAINQDNKTLYRTGDLAKIDEDGLIYYLGRIDEQVKLNGFRIELGEIESALSQDSRISSCVVLAVKGSSDYLVAFYSAKRPIAENEIKQRLSKTLTEYMVPSFYVYLEKMPLTPNGKINRKALRAIFEESHQSSGQKQAEPPLEKQAEKPVAVQATAQKPPVAEAPPKSAKKQFEESSDSDEEVLKNICDIFAKALGALNVNTESSFFDLGGSSLTAIHVAMQCMKRGYNIVYGDIFDHPTPKELAALCMERRQGKSQGATDAKKEIDPIASYDYSALDTALKSNTAQTLKKSDRPTNILLTGATGFLGIHVLYEFLRSGGGVAYCPIRPGKNIGARERLESLLTFYFSEPMEELFDNRIIVCDGDITEDGSVMSWDKYDFDYVINCSACVKHFVKDNILERVNVEGVANLASLCQKTGARLIHVSTASVAGYSVGGKPPIEKALFENELYIGQTIENAYSSSKFRAERLILERLNSGLKAKIMRVGNLMPRISDGEFQINFLTNGFMKRLKAYKLLGMFPYGAMNNPVEFSPIDCTAQAILKLMHTADDYTVYHPYNNHKIFMSDVIYMMNDYGFKIDTVDDDVFNRALSAKISKSNKSSEILGSLFAYNSSSAEARVMIRADNKFTSEALYRLNFKWPIISDVYMKKAIEKLEGLGFFDKDFDGDDD